jgi:hypothetical protein
MTWTMNIYRRAAVVLWGVVSLVVGLSIGAYFGMGSKKVLFVVVLVVGLYVIVLLRLFRKQEGEKDSFDSVGGSGLPDQRPGEEPVGLDQEEKLDLSRSQEETVGKISTGGSEDGGKATDDASREWIDDFLVKQQKD